MPGREAGPTPVPRDLGMGLPGHHAGQIQGLPFSHMGGGGLDSDGWTSAWDWGTGRDQWAETPTLMPSASALGAQIFRLDTVGRWP